jgi:MFS family permease
MSDRRLPASANRLLGALFFSTFAVSIQLTAVGLLVWRITGDELALGIVGLAEFIPNLLLAPIVGTAADRFDRRVVGVTALCAEIVFSIALALYAASDPTSAVPIYFIVFGFGVARAFASPAIRAIPGDLVDSSLLSTLIPRTSLMWQASSIIGPALPAADQCRTSSPQRRR